MVPAVPDAEALADNAPAPAPAARPAPTRRPVPPPALPPITEGVKFSWIPPDTTKRFIDHELIWLIVLPTAAALSLAYWKAGLPLPQCNLKTFTGVPCVTCGATRSVEKIVDHFDILGAFLMNPLVFVGYVFTGIFLVYAAIVLAFRLPRFRVQVAGKAAWKLRHFIILVTLLNWIYVVAMGR